MTPQELPTEQRIAIIGYARVSTPGQSTDSQVDALCAAGAERVLTDHGESSRVKDRPQWIECQNYLRSSDTLLVRGLDRLAGTETMALHIVHELGERGVGLKSLTEPDIDTSTPMGRAMLGIVAVFMQLCVDIIRDNTTRGLAHACCQGRVGGRPTVMTEERLRAARSLQNQGHSLTEIALALGVSRSSLWRAIGNREK